MKPQKPKTKFVCCICGKSSETGPDLCSVNLHNFEVLKLNQKKNGYLGAFSKGTVHLSCIQKYLPNGKDEPGKCVVCRHSINGDSTPGLKLAIYVYRKRGCSAALDMHENCFKKIKSKSFPLIRLPEL